MYYDKWFNRDDWPRWLLEAFEKGPGEGGLWAAPDADAFCCGTLEGVMLGNWHDYIIQGVNGEIYPCKPDIFWKTYDHADVEEEENVAD